MEMRTSNLKRPVYPMPEFVAAALSEAGLTEAYRSRPPYQQNDYIGWIMRAKRTETREKRLRQMLVELKGGDKYMNMSYRPKRTEAAAVPPEAEATDAAANPIGRSVAREGEI